MSRQLRMMLVLGYPFGKELYRRNGSVSKLFKFNHLLQKVRLTDRFQCLRSVYHARALFQILLWLCHRNTCSVSSGFESR